MTDSRSLEELRRIFAEYLNEELRPFLGNDWELEFVPVEGADHD